MPRNTAVKGWSPGISDRFLSRVNLGENHRIDENVILGYPTGRCVEQQALIIGDEAAIRSGTIIYQGTSIGARLATGHNVVIREENTIGDDFTIWSNSVVDYGCRIGDRVKVHANCYLAQHTTIEDDVFLAPGVTIANDLHPGCADSQHCMQGPIIRKGVQIGVNATLLPFLTIGERAVIGSGTVVINDVPPCAVVVGNPGRVICDIKALKCSRGIRDKPY